MAERFQVAIIGSGYAGSLTARVLASQGYRVVLLERGAHPRFAIGESSTPLANLSLERLARRYNLPDCYRLATYGRWREHFPDVRRGLKRGFTFYRHHPGATVTDNHLAGERLLVAASPSDAVADTHWLRADVDHHFVRAATRAGVDYRDHVDLTDAAIGDTGAMLRGQRNGVSFEIHADFVIDASGPGGFLARQLAIPSGLSERLTRSSIVFSHFTGVRSMTDVYRGFPLGSYDDDLAAVHHLIDEGWMYSLRFDHGVTSAGFALTPRGVAALGIGATVDAEELWRRLLARYPTIAAVFAEARPIMPLTYRGEIQHRLTKASGPRWMLLPHAYAFVDPLFSTGIAWSLRAVERIGSIFDAARATDGVPSLASLERYAALLSREADQIDTVVAGAYEAMAHYELFEAQAMLYFAAVSFAEVRQRLQTSASDAPWSGFLGVGDDLLDQVPVEAYARLRRITQGEGRTGSREERREFVDWARAEIAPRNVAGLADPSRRGLYPVDLELLIERHHLLGMTRDQVVAGLPALRGISPEPATG